MKFVGKTFLVLSIIASFLVLWVSVSARFQLLSSDFWINSLRSGNVYPRLTEVLATESQRTFIEDGAGPGEIQEITKIFAVGTVQDIAEKNIVLVLDYVNGKKNTMVVYFPLELIPRDVRQTLDITTDEISVNKLVSTFGRSSTPFGEEIFVQLRTLGNYLTISFFIAVISLALNIFFLYRMEEKGRRLIAIPISFILSGVISLILILLINIQTKNLSQEFAANSHEPLQMILGTAGPPIIYNITQLWTILSIVTIIIGGLLLLVRKGPKEEVKLTPLVAQPRPLAQNTIPQIPQNRPF